MNEQIVLDIQVDTAKVAQELNAVSVTLSDLKNEQKELNAEIKAGHDDTGELSKAYAANAQQIKVLTAQQKALTGQLQTTDKSMDQLGTSFREMDANVRQLENQYKSLTKEQRESAAGQEMKKNLIAQKEALKEMDAELGNHQRSVGNYEAALGGLGSKLKSAKAAMQALWANPWAAIIAGLVLIIKKLIDAFKRSEERMNELRAAVAPLKGIGDMLTRTFDALAKVVGKVLVDALQTALKGIKWIAAQLDKIGRALGKDWGLTEAFEEASEKVSELTAAEQAYIKHKRAWVEQEAVLENKIAKLRDKAAQKDKYNAEERVKFMEQAIALEQQKADEQVKLAKEELRIAELNASRAENDQEANDRLAEARANVTRANTDYYNSVRRMQGQLAAFRAEVLQTAEAEEDAANEVTAATEKEEQKRLEERRKAHEKLQQKILEWTQSDIKRLEDEMQRDLETADITAEEKIAIEQHYQEEIGKIREQAAEEERQRQQSELQAKISEAEQYVSAIMGTMSAIMSAVNAKQDAELARYEEDNKKMKKTLDKRLKDGLISQEEYDKQVEAADEELAQKKYEIELAQAKQNKAMGIMDATISTAIAIIKALADPGGFAGLALSVLAATTGAAQIAAIAAEPLPQRFATGGIVGGTSYTGDMVPARLNSGEMVLNKDSQQRLFEALSSGDGQTLGVDYEMMAAAMASVPAPVVVYSELEQFGQRVSTYNEIASI